MLWLLCVHRLPLLSLSVSLALSLSLSLSLSLAFSRFLSLSLSLSLSFSVCIRIKQNLPAYKMCEKEQGDEGNDKGEHAIIRSTI